MPDTHSSLREYKNNNTNINQNQIVMRKLFAFFAAALFAVTMSAEVICTATLESIDKNNNETGIAQTGCTMAWLGITSDKDFVTIDGHKYYKFSSNDSYVRLILDGGDKFQEGDVVSIAVAANQSKTVSVAFSSGNKTTEVTVSNTEAGVVTRTLEAADILEDGSIKMNRGGNSNIRVCSFSVERETSTEPMLNVDKESVELNATLANPAPKAEVTFSGKNLAAGKYALNVPNLAKLSVAPVEVEVGADGKLSAKVVITFAPKEDVAAGSTKISLTIGELTKEVAIAYSASFVKNYEYATSVNIEQWVLDNGKNNEAFKAVLQAAKIEYQDINELDSLNDAKTARNEPFLGLKLKKQGAFMALWLKQGSTVRVKFGKVSDNVIGSISGEEETFTPEFLANPLEFTAPVDCYMKLTTTTDNTIVIKQIMIDEPIAEVTLPGTTAIDNTAVDAKATKRIVNGRVIIEQNGKLYNALGAEVK